MFPGESVDNRFLVEAEAASGGMATVYRAWDRVAGARVAIKVLHTEGSAHAERLTREAGLLAELDHDGIVRYVAHGRTVLGAPYLAMEWLEGVTLAQHFADARVSGARMFAATAVKLALRVSQALAVAHRRSVVHRDVKPANIFLPDGDIARAKIVDFGIARRSRGVRELTLTGAVVGTPGYMAPEQARGAEDVDARADVFALGCVLHECLTGQPAFIGEQMIAVLAKILLEDVPRLRELVPETPARLDELVARLMAKEPDDRPRDANEVLGELELIAAELGRAPLALGSSAPVARALGRAEQRILSVLLAQEALPRWPEGEAPTVRLGDQAPPEGELRAAVAPYGGRLEPVVDGSIAVIVSGAASALDQAGQAARCALVLRRLLPDAPIAVATGRALWSSRLPVGEAIDRAVRLLAVSEKRVALDETTAGLLDSRFDVAGDAAGLYLRGELAEETTRTVLGKPTPCVGREHEIERLLATFRHCAAESTARAVLVTAAPGTGKSRLRRELLKRIREQAPEITVLTGRGDSLAAGAPFGIIAPALRRLCGILDGEPLAVRQRRLRARLGLHLAPGPAARVCAFLGEMVGVPVADERNDALRAARGDPKLMGDGMRGAWQEWLAAETQLRPTVIVLDDLHWGDLPSVALIDAALRNLADRPLFVLALARPDVHAQFPRLWAERPVEEIRLGPLVKRAAARLVRDILGTVEDDVVDKIVRLADGNAFYLEEMIRAIGAGATDLPVTVLGMVQARLDGLDEEARRVLRAASVFGDHFWRGGVLALCGERTLEGWAGLDELLDDLAARELLIRRGVATLPGERELSFRHALVREAAYASLTSADRALGHRLAGAWLERTVGAAETDRGAWAMVLAQHFDLGGEPAAALRWYRRGAEQALEGNDLPTAIARAERAASCGAAGETLGALRLIQAEAHDWRGARAEAARCAEAAVRVLAPGRSTWFRAIAEAIEASCLLGDVARAVELAREARGAPVAPDDVSPGDARAEQLACLSRAALVLLFSGRREISRELVAQIDALAGDLDGLGRRVVGRVRELRALDAYYAGDVEGNLVGLEAALAAYQAAGDTRAACQTLAYVGFAHLELGSYHAAEETLTQALAQGERLGLGHVVAVAWKNLGIVLAARGELEEASAVEGRAVALFRELGVPRMEGAARRTLATIACQRGDAVAAEAEARRAIELLAAAPPKRMGGLAVLARALLLQGRVDEALAHARAAAAMFEEVALADECHALVPLVLAETLQAAGLHDEGARVILAAREALLERAGRITDESLRRTFLAGVPENARTLALAREVLAGGRGAARDAVRGRAPPPRGS